MARNEPLASVMSSETVTAELQTTEAPASDRQVTVGVPTTQWLAVTLL
ncbi:MAG: hypothetical protein QOF58_6885, partial [Pseudonocardiales bacterium]|nr:hypothetical protein [Pseudonocardiales bacterium]